MFGIWASVVAFGTLGFAVARELADLVRATIRFRTVQAEYGERLNRLGLETLSAAGKINTPPPTTSEGAN